MNRKNRLIAVLIAILLTLAGCRAPQPPKDYARQLPPGATALRKIVNPADKPDFTIASFDLENLQQAISNSLNYMAKPSSQTFFPHGHITHDHATASLHRFSQFLESGLRGRQLNEAIRRDFDVYVSVGCDDAGTVLYTGYYTPIFDGSTQRTERFKYPLYKQPPDLVKASNGKVLGKRLSNGRVTDYPTRQQIENSGMLKGNELVWLSNPFEVYICHVQGSAYIKLPDGKIVTAGYAASNGRPYHSVSKEMVADGTIPVEHMSLTTMINYFRDHQKDIARYTHTNPRYIFFQLTDSAPRGSINEPVIAMRTIATDKTVYPRASLAFISAKLPVKVAGNIESRSYTGFVLDQDTGGAIRAPGRCDVYMGRGNDAGRMAGQTYQEGKLYYLFLKSSYLLRK
jgi:membrane-bound lytic murein transglycosylase A